MGMNIAVLYREMAASEKELLKKFTQLASNYQITILPYNINALSEESRINFINDFSGIADKKKVRLLLHSIARGNLKPLTNAANETTGSALTAEDIQLTGYAMSASLLDWTRAVLEANLFNDDARIIGLTSEGAHKYWDSYAAVVYGQGILREPVHLYGGRI